MRWEVIQRHTTGQCAKSERPCIHSILNGMSLSNPPSGPGSYTEEGVVRLKEPVGMEDIKELLSDTISKSDDI